MTVDTATPIEDIDEWEQRRERLEDFLIARREAKPTEFRSSDAYDAIGLAVNERTEPAKQRVCGWIRRDGWRNVTRERPVPGGLKAIKVWVLDDRDDNQDFGVVNRKSRSLLAPYLDVIDALTASNSILTRSLSIEDAAQLEALRALCEIVKSPRRRTASQLAVVAAAKTLLSSDGLRGLQLVRHALERITRNAERLARAAERAAAPALPEPPTDDDGFEAI